MKVRAVTLCWLVVTLSSGATSAADRTFNPTIVGIYDDAFLADYAGGKLIQLKGEPYEMGVQYGYLLVPELNSLFLMLEDRVCELFELDPVIFDLLKQVVVAAYRPYFPADVIEELTGICDGATLRFNAEPAFDLDDLIMANSLVDALATFDLESFACCGFAAWGPLTQNGKLFSTRNIDLFTGLGLENYTLVTIVKEAGKAPIANIGFVGMVGCIAGMSARALSFAQIWGYSTDMAFGTPWPLNARKILQTADDIDDAVRVFEQTQRTYGSNFVFSDGRNNAGVTIETTATMIAHFYDDDPHEDAAVWNGECYAVRMPNAVYRGAIALDPLIRRHQTDAVNGPDGDPRETDTYRVRYKGQADRIQRYQENGQPIGVDEAMTISQEVAIRGESMLCVVYANTDLEFFAAFSYIDAAGNVFDAWEMPYHYVPFNDYLPTINTDLNKSRFRPGDDLRYTLRTTNFGHEQTVDLYLAFKVGDVYYYYPSFGTEAEALTLQLADDEYPTNRITIAFTFGFDAPPGDYSFIAALLERDTGRLLDLDQQSFTFWR